MESNETCNKDNSVDIGRAPALGGREDESCQEGGGKLATIVELKDPGAWLTPAALTPNAIASPQYV